ncbi:hypothetical protein KA005_35780, partial [bacterium]|nr:hypothetical protein [bacterium]
VDLGLRRDYNLFIVLPAVLFIFGYVSGCLVLLFLRLVGRTPFLRVYRMLYIFCIGIIALFFLLLLILQIYYWFNTQEVIPYVFALPGLIILPSRAYKEISNAQSE